MKKLYVSPDAEYLKIDFIEDVLAGSPVVDPDLVDKGEVDLDLGGLSGDARTTF